MLMLGHWENSMDTRRGGELNDPQTKDRVF